MSRAPRFEFTALKGKKHEVVQAWTLRGIRQFYQDYKRRGFDIPSGIVDTRTGQQIGTE